MATLTTQYWHRRVLAMTGQRLNSCNLSRILVMSPVRRAKGIFSMETELQLLCCKVSIFKPELHFIYWSQVQFSRVNGLLRDSDLNIPNSRYRPELDTSFSLPLSSYKSFFSWKLIERGFCWYWNIISYLVSWRHWPRFLTPPVGLFLSCFRGRNKWLSSQEGKEISNE